MYAIIVVPLDGSALGERALSAAVALAHRGDAVLELVHVREPALRASGVPVIDSRFDDEAEQQVRARVKSLADTLARECDLSTRAVFLDGEIAAAVQAYVVDRGADLVVMTTHGRGGFSCAWLGSVADELVRLATAPLLLVRPDAADASDAREPLFRRILVPLDGSPRAEEVLTHAAAFGTGGGTAYLLLNVVTPESTAAGPVPDLAVLVEPPDLASHLQDERVPADAYVARVTDSFRESGADATAHTVLHEQISHAILDFAREQAVDLIVLSTRVQSRAEGLRIGSVADKVLRGAAVPVLLCGPLVEVVAPHAQTSAIAAKAFPSALAR